jgi:hypothetical protein
LSPYRPPRNPSDLVRCVCGRQLADHILSKEHGKLCPDRRGGVFRANSLGQPVGVRNRIAEALAEVRAINRRRLERR